MRPRCAAAVAGLMLVAMAGNREFVQGQSASATQPGMRPEDTFAVREIGEVEISPDGTTVIFTLSSVDLAANRTRAQVMTIPSSGGQPSPVVGLPDAISHIRWSPDGTRVAFFGTQNGKGAIWTRHLPTGALTRVCDYDRSNSFLPQTAAWLAWSPDGREIAFVGSDEPAPVRSGPVVATRIRYKSRTGFSDNRRAHIFVVAASGGTPRKITSGTFDEHSIDWDAKGREIVFVSNREADPDAVHNYDIFAVDVSTKAVRQVTATPGVETSPCVSPDGQWIAYLATTRPVTTIDSVAEDAHVWIVPFGGGRARELNASLDRRAQSIQWMPNGKDILFSAADHGKTLLYRVSRDGGASRPVVDVKAQITPFAVAKDGTVVAGLTSPEAPREVYRIDGTDGSVKQLTELNNHVVRKWRLSRPETLSFKSKDGTDVEGLFYAPLASKGRAPMLLNIHGGPHGMFGYGFDTTAQVYAAHGYAVVALNPRGSTGYGQKFSDGSLENWGGGDYEDLMAGLDYVLATRNDVDPDRLGVTGRSYGGFMTNWIITQTDRFKAAVSVASVANLISFYGTSVYQDLIHAEFRGQPWEGDNFALLWKWSPLSHVRKAKTPTLFIHGEQDNDVHVTEPEAMYMALRRQGIRAAFARYPREGHRFREPLHNLDALSRTLSWMDQYLMTPSTQSK